MEANHEVLRRQFALLDASFCFVAKHCTCPTVRSILRVANSFGSLHLTRQHLVELAAVAPELLVLNYPKKTKPQNRFDDVYSPAVINEEDMEIVTFPLEPHRSQRASTKRKQLFEAALQSNNIVPQIQEQTKEPPVLTKTSQRCREKEAGKPSKSTPKKPMQLDNDWGSSILAMLQQSDFYQHQIVHVERRKARPAHYRALEPLQLSTRVCQALKKCYNIQELYSHQFETIDAIRRGENAVLSTATASGKSLAYNVPMLNMLLEDPNATFIYLFPTKALAQDQLKALRRLLEAADLPLYLAATFDGDTPIESRSIILRETRIFLTNPDMLHLTILPQHRQWTKVLQNLRLMVVDEAHMYRGVFGSHVSCVFRRLFRLCALNGSNPQVVCCSATIQNPRAHFCQLLPTLPHHSTACARNKGESETENILGPPSLDFFRQRQLRVITEDGAPSVEKIFCIWNPKGTQLKSMNTSRSPEISSESFDASKPISSDQPSKKRKRSENLSKLQKTNDSEQRTDANRSSSAIFNGSQLLARFVEAEIATLLFCRGRKLTELVLMNVHSILNAKPDTRRLLHRVSSYRGGYTLKCRRQIEQRLFNGYLLGVVATNALELGIDIGELDCTIHLGLPSSIASLWQQAGRAGRRQQQAKQKESVAVIVCFDAPLDQHFAQKQHAMELFNLEPEAVSLNAMNCRVLGQHLLCAARESPLYSAQSGTAYIDTFIFGDLNHTVKEGDAPVRSEIGQVLDPLVNEKKLMKCLEATGHWHYRVHSCMPKKFRAVSLRSICEEQYTVLVPSDRVVHDVAEGEVLDEIPEDKAFFQVYPTAVYLHQAQEYLITRLDSVERIAFAEKCREPLTYFTTCRDCTDLEVVRVHSWQALSCNRDEGETDTVRVCVGTVSIQTRVFGSTMLEKRTMRLLGTHEFSLPPMQSFGEALWLELPRGLRSHVEGRSGRSWTAALHGVGHLFVALVRLFVLCDAEDIGTEHVNEFEQRNKPNRVTIFERREGGSGLIPEIVKILPELIEKAWTIASECACTDGCPACIQSTGCSEYNHVLDKRGSLQVLQYLNNVAHGAAEF